MTVESGYPFYHLPLCLPSLGHGDTLLEWHVDPVPDRGKWMTPTLDHNQMALLGSLWLQVEVLLLPVECSFTSGAPIKSIFFPRQSYGKECRLNDKHAREEEEEAVVTS